jgi:HEAT repeat protein
VADYLIELGPAVAPLMLQGLQDPSPATRANVALVLGAIGGEESLTALQPLTQDRAREVVQAATRAMERIRMR